MPGSSPHKYLSFLSLFFRFWFVLFAYLFCCFSINIYRNNCYLIKWNNSKEKYCAFSREKIVNILNIWINKLNFCHFLGFTVEKPELITIWLFSKQRSHELTIVCLWFVLLVGFPITSCLKERGKKVKLGQFSHFETVTSTSRRLCVTIRSMTARDIMCVSRDATVKMTVTESR